MQAGRRGRYLEAGVAFFSPPGAARLLLALLALARSPLPAWLLDLPPLPALDAWSVLPAGDEDDLLLEEEEEPRDAMACSLDTLEIGHRCFRSAAAAPVSGRPPARPVVLAPGPRAGVALPLATHFAAPAPACGHHRARSNLPARIKCRTVSTALKTAVGDVAWRA
jgi:hypothetical protein